MSFKFNVKSVDLFSGGIDQEYLSPYGVITPRDCPFCKKPNPKVYCTSTQLEEFRKGEKHIQEILFDKDADDRETILTGICPSCWNIVMGEEDEDVES